MMRVLILTCVALLFSSCVYIDIKTPLDTDVNRTRLGEKVGSAKTRSVLWLVAWGDGSTAAAAKGGDIHTVTHLDVRYYSLLFGLYAERETIAYGD